MRLSEPGGTIVFVHLGIAHHLGWAVVVSASDDHTVADKRRIELIEPELPAAPIHHEGGPHLLHRRADPLSDKALAALVAKVRDSAAQMASAELDQLTSALNEPVSSISLRAWATDFPEDIAVLRRVPYEARADSVMYRQVLAEQGSARGWAVHLYGPDVEDQATDLLGSRAYDVLHGPRKNLGPPWSKDHRTALAATVLVSFTGVHR